MRVDDVEFGGLVKFQSRFWRVRGGETKKRPGTVSLQALGEDGKRRKLYRRIIGAELVAVFSHPKTFRHFRQIVGWLMHAASLEASSPQGVVLSQAFNKCAAVALNTDYEGPTVDPLFMAWQSWEEKIAEDRKEEFNDLPGAWDDWAWSEFHDAIIAFCDAWGVRENGAQPLKKALARLGIFPQY